MRKSSGKERGEYDFDADLPKGEYAERLLANVLENARIEVKRDLKLGDTGNIAIEYRCRGKASGIAATKAQWWAEVLGGEEYKDEVIILIKVDRLKRLLRQHKDRLRRVEGGDEGKSKMILLKPSALLWPATDT